MLSLLIACAAMRRSTFLKVAAAGALGAGLAATGSLAHAAGRREPTRALEVKKIADLTGPGITTRFRMEATDLGIPATTPDGRTLFVFGDTFENAQVGGGWWRSPVALWSETGDLNGGVTWSGAVGGDAAQQLWAYDHDNPQFSTVLPSDVITIGDTMYLHAMVNKGLGNVVWTEIWRSDDSGATWAHTGAKFAPDLHGGMFQLLTWGLGDDGYVYLFSTGFQRDKPMILQRVPADKIADPAAYEPWGWKAEGGWAWGNPPSPVLEGRFGELCLRPLDGKWVLTWFNEGDYRIDGIIMDTPTSNLYEARRETLLWGTSWGNEDDSHVAQLYGGYIIPGSTIGELHLAVSQWNTNDGWPYRVMQHRVRGFTP
ncbi:hypothetical protein Snas_2970 [Stackebrandtia nassauensis DSM 44728]|uniref:DUF4185 domain-containing protein n=2 Tax=Stackebrandtia TaxID=283810 RepID=D3Q9G3_STANL|nr:hypothetical protein Snas_2970 [Stackebrandtia nassauensis DSM 44728]